MKMGTSLARKLIERGVIRTNTEIDIAHKGVDLAGLARADTVVNCYLKGVKINSRTGDVFLTLTDTRDGTPYSITQNEIVAIDGMSVSRLVENYNLDADGNDIPEGPRRGRKPKSRLPVMNDLVDDGEDEEEDEEDDG